MLRLERFVLVVIICGQLPEDVELLDGVELDFAVTAVKLLGDHVAEESWQE